MAATESARESPAVMDWLLGWVVMEGASATPTGFTIKVAESLEMLPAALVMITE